jgi:hypothetical protein
MVKKFGITVVIFLEAQLEFDKRTGLPAIYQSIRVMAVAHHAPKATPE